MMVYFESRFVFGDDIYVDDHYMDERWAFIDEFPDYMISDKGRVWSEKTQQFIKVKPMDDHGHMGVCLCKNGSRYYRYIHRLVAKAFIPNPHNLPIVRHLYDDPSQNEVDDLAWGTQRDNIHDAINNKTAYVLTDVDREKHLSVMRTPIKAIKIDDDEYVLFRSQADASKSLGIQQSNIWKVLNGFRASAGGYRFEYCEKEGCRNVSY